MSNQPQLNPDALKKVHDAARSHEPSCRARLITVEELSERVIRAYLAVAQPEVQANSKPNQNLELIEQVQKAIDQPL